MRQSGDIMFIMKAVEPEVCVTVIPVAVALGSREQSPSLDAVDEAREEQRRWEEARKGKQG